MCQCIWINNPTPVSCISEWVQLDALCVVDVRCMDCLLQLGVIEEEGSKGDLKAAREAERIIEDGACVKYVVPTETLSGKGSLSTFCARTR